MSIFETNVFNQSVWLKKWLIRVFGTLSYSRFNWQNTTDIQGAERLLNLADRNVLLVSNHQTYFADVALMHHTIQSAFGGTPNDVGSWSFLKCKKPNLYYVAAEETMKSGILPRIFKRVGAVTVKRTWRAKGQDVKRAVDTNDTDNIAKALSDGWVISFPQGTTTPFAPGRKGTAHIIKQHKPIVIPIVINGFRRAFDKKGLFYKKKGTTLSLWVKPPLEIDYSAPVETILDMVIDGIEQSEAHNWAAQFKGVAYK